MRRFLNRQLELDAIDIPDIQFDLHSRDDIPQLLLGWQHVYQTPELRDQVFKILLAAFPAAVDMTTGRPGMDLGKILVLGTLRLNCNWDFDKVHEMANQHRTLRLMLGHGNWSDDR